VSGHDLPISAEQWREEIHRRLDALRPARYHQDDMSWAQPVYDWAAANMPPALREQVLRELRDEWAED
jgi:hypothetical protein